MKEEVKDQSKKKMPAIKIISIIIWAISLAVSVCLIYLINKLNVVPNKFFIGITLLIGAVELIALLIILLKKKGKVLISIIDIALIAIIAAESFASVKIKSLQGFVESNLKSGTATSVYSIITSSASSITSTTEMSNKDIHYINSEDGDNKSKLTEKITSTIENANLIEETDQITAMTDVTKNDDYILIANSGLIDLMNSIDYDYESKIKVIETFTLDLNDSENEKNTTIDGIAEDAAGSTTDTTKSFIVYFSGIDTRSGTLPSKSLTDSNIIIAVNPNTKNILLVHVPRDYYVQVHGTTGLKDKFTHSGIIGGINLSKATLEDVFGIEIPYYIRANFNSVPALVDAIGGINIYNDQDHTIKCNYKGYEFTPGWNYNVDGDKAFAFAHERYAYKEGDRHRGENQEQVITRVIEKMSSSTELLKNYDSILKAMTGTFETNFTYNNISSFIKMQLDNMAEWNVETYNVDGDGKMDYTASYPKQKLYVMYPDYSTVETAKEKINELLGE